jgi:muramoyltetrapeptide carboxypeptidase LdcA involved in peptidoglycan recycling
VLLLETSEDLIPASEFGYITRSLGERGLLSAVDAVVVARAAAGTREDPRTAEARTAHREAQRDVAVETVGRYNPDAVVVVGVPFGHTRPQWVLPYGGTMTVDSRERRIWADYD